MNLDPIVVLDARVVTGAGGGPEKTILNSPRFLKPAGYEMLCAYMRPPGDLGFERLIQRAETLGATLLPVDDRGPFDRKVIKFLLEICIKNDVKIWHAHDYKSNVFGLLLQRRWPMRLVTTVHGWVERTWRTPIYYATDRITLPRYERVLCVSEDLRNRCLKFGVPEERCLLVDNAIDATQYDRTLTVDDAKRAIGVPPNRILIGAAGRLSDEKGFGLLIRAIDRLLAKGMDLELHIAGEGRRCSDLHELIHQLGRSDRVRLLGYQSDLIPFYQALDLFVLSSLREGLPNVLLEAMASGVPVVSTRVAGIPRLVNDGRSGLLVESGSSESLASSIARLATDPDLRQALAREGLDVIRNHFSFETRMARIRSIYDDLMDRATPRPEPTTS
ncbi:glycosyltransferase family 4 protein [Tautonia rosea]|uniref:glycosyltransferase family 4 protein n=1 Tax=Tautonia rosea TaxID=2728037 RepID=UPI00147644EB|nr:glycosyltransferase family 4 protein [Tautonia rosea]